jgi:hypothetical protein
MIVLLFALRLRRHMFDVGVGGVDGGGDHVLASWMVRVGKLWGLGGRAGGRTGEHVLNVKCCAGHR